MFQTRMAEARQTTGAAARGTTRGDYHADYEISLIVVACVFPWYKSSTKGQLF